MTHDLTAAERELAEALCLDGETLLKMFCKSPHWLLNNPSMCITYAAPMIRFAATYELARRERERNRDANPSPS